MVSSDGLGQHPLQISGGKEEKRKRWTSHTLTVTTLLLLMLAAAPAPPAAADGDGVAITLADYQGLQAFRHALFDPRGILRSWNDTGLGACSGAWLGIKCVKGKVIAIQLPWRGLGGRISEKVGQLTALRKLSLHDNFIGGQIPPAIGFITELRGLHLFNNRFSGAIPPEIGRCPLLQTIDLSNNLLTGDIPSSVSNSTKLLRLNLSYNNLSGSIPVSVSRLLSLKALILSNNRLNGSIPSELGGLRSLQTLDLSNNSIGGSFPTTISNLSSLVLLDLERNQLDGQIPDSIDGLKNLSVFSVKYNRLGGEIPARLGNVITLSHLDLSDNNFTGEIPASLTRLSSLTFFNVSDNNLSGKVPVLLSQRFNSSSFRGNVQLCGYRGSVPCPSSPATNPPPPLPSRRHRRLSTKDIILIACGGVLLLLLLLCCILLCCLVRKRRALSQKSRATGGAAGTASGRGEKPGPAAGAEAEAGGEVGGKLVHFDGGFVFTADDLLCATAEIMGKSTYGTVYKATLDDGNQVAVKRLREKTAKGQKEFETEVNILGKIRYPNLLALRAYYLGPKGEKLLVFDFMPKGSLAAYLHARGPETPVDWPTRMRIAIGAARGVSYLHNDMTMIHGNLTSSNILLDDALNAKIADFSLSRLMTAAANSNVIATAGALGYRAPELSKLKKANPKTDVFSLGVVILELLTGKSPGESMNGMDLPQWVASIVKEEWTNEVFDLELMKDAAAAGTTGDELLNTLKLALHCVDPSPTARPDAQQVLRQLEEIKPELAGVVSAGGSAGQPPPPAAAEAAATAASTSTD